MPPSLAAEVFGSNLSRAEQFHDLLAGPGTERGLIGPRETERLWDRHLVNCAIVTELLPEGAVVADIGSGAGLPGIAMAIRRPDLRVRLVDSLARRTEFLSEVVHALSLGDRVDVVHGRVEDPAVRAELGASLQWTTARAVAPLDRLVRWCLPLLVPGGRLLALKGATAAEEVVRYERSVRRSGADQVEVVHCGVGLLQEPTTVVSVRRGR